MFWNNEIQEVDGEFIWDSVYNWPSLGKAHTKNGKSNAKDGDLWQQVRGFVQEKGVVATGHDYHGNFNSDLFDAIFTRLC